MNRLGNLIQSLCPDGLEYKTLGEICDITRGRVMSKNYIRENEGVYPVYSSQTGNKGIFGYIKTFDYDCESITWTTDGANAGSVFYHKNEKFSITNVCGLLRLKDAVRSSMKFVYYSLQVFTKNYVSDGMGNPKLMSNAMMKVIIPIPPLPIKQEIVRILDTFTALEAELEAELEKRKAQYEHYRNELLTFGDDTLIISLGEMLQPKGYIRGPFGSALKKEYFVGNGVPVYEQQHAIYGKREFRYFIDDKRADTLKRFLVKPQDLIISCSGTIGRISIIDQKDPEGIINQALLILRLNLSKVLIKYVKYYLEAFPNLIICSTGGAITNIEKREVIEGIKIPLPPLEEQKRIVATLDRFDALVNDIAQGLPAEITARRKQYEYYRDKLLTFKRKEAVV